VLTQATAGTSNLVPCGLEPGLTEIFVRAMFDQCEMKQKIQVQCGVNSFPPNIPLNYQLLFGAHLPLMIRILETSAQATNTCLLPKCRGIHSV